MGIQTNIYLAESDVKIVERMMAESGYDNRSAFIRWLIRQEWAHRYIQPKATDAEDE